jgi:alkanesulfonate monooxygenase SsuD/methylene tetrahydromethanopterin reductase-like flavin-dependent oxidoreductase (luciferase family)
MKFGNILFPYNGEPSRDANLITELLQEAQISEEAGLDAIWLAEHHFSGICPYADPIGLASAIAATTRRIRIGFSVLQASFHHPVKLAEQIAFLDNLSRGRMIIGLGRGNMGALYEYDAYKVKEEETQERLMETERLLIELLSGACAHDGKYWQFKIPALRPRPFTTPHPILLRSAVKDASFIELARQNRPFLAAFTTEAEFVRKIDLYRTEMRAAGASADAIDRNLANSWTWRRVFVSETSQEAEQIGVPAYRAMQVDRRTESERLHAAVGRTRNPSQAGEDAFIYGVPERVAETVAKMEQAGIGGIILQFRLGAMPAEIAENSLRLFMKEVAPCFRRGVGFTDRAQTT